MDAYRMIYTGTVAAILPGIGAGAFGAKGFVGASAVAAVLVLSTSGVRAGLKAFIWYRWFFSLMFATTLAFVAISSIAPEHKTWTILVCLFIQLFLLGGFYPYFEGYRPPDNERIPRG